jgi:Lrp/AsnC family leucine-responsive transcriptional regulator
MATRLGLLGELLLGDVACELCGEWKIDHGKSVGRRYLPEKGQKTGFDPVDISPATTFGTLTFRSEKPLDNVDWRILAELQQDGRLSFKELGRRINLSPPAVAERVRRLEDSGVITGYQAKVDPAEAGQPVSAFVEMRCRPGKCLLMTSNAEDYPEVVEIHKLTGDHCSMLKVRATSVEHLEGLFDRLSAHGELRSQMVLSTQYEGRPVEPPTEDPFTAPHSEGWRR